jgi:hypothetical protein
MSSRSVAPVAGSGISLITWWVRVSSTVVPRPQVTATMVPSGLTATDEPVTNRSIVLPSGTSVTTSPVSGSRKVAATFSVSGPGLPERSTVLKVPVRVGATMRPPGTACGRLAIQRPVRPGYDSPKPPSALMSHVMIE